MIDVDKIQIGDKLRVASDEYSYEDDNGCDIKVGTILPVVEDDLEREDWIDLNGVEFGYIGQYEACHFTLVATNTKYLDIDEGDLVEIACLSDEQIATWNCEHIIDQQGEVIHKSKSIHVEIDGKEWCLQPENLRVVRKAETKAGKAVEGVLNVDGLKSSQFPTDIAPKDIEGCFVNPLNKQVSGDHYKSCSIQPIEYIHANGLDYFQGNVVKYVTRHKDKNGAGDIKKAIHYLELILELQYKDE